MMATQLLVAASLPCGSCHVQQARQHEATMMAHTLSPPAQSPVFRKSPALRYTMGPYKYEVDAQRYRVTDGASTIDAPIHWAIGQGEAGQTWVIEHNGRLMESRVSYYADANSLGSTIGAPPGLPKNLLEAAGRELTPRALTECFNCHSAPPAELPAGVTRGTLAWTQALRAGVQCESCHLRTDRHAASVAAAAKPELRPPSLKKVGAEELSDVCGKCHRTWADIASNGPRGVGNVRFQPYRIARSKCYDAADARISCTACHDAHNRPDRAAAIAATKPACLSCHQQGCKTGATQDCATCHLPKYEIPGSHFSFTDHWIRVVRNKNEYPD